MAWLYQERRHGHVTRSVKRGSKFEADPSGDTIGGLYREVALTRLAVNLLGGFRVTLDSGAPCVLPTKKAQALLAYLALAPGRAYPRDVLASLLWGDRGDAQARKSLRQTVYALRKAVLDARDVLLHLEGESIALNPAAVDVDVPRFEQLVSGATPEALERAAALYRGDLLHGFIVQEAGFEEWLVAERERLRELAIEALAKLLAHQAKTSETERSIQTASRLLALDPLQEAVHRTLMRLYARQGRRATALRQYQVCVEFLQRELRTEPEVETKRLYQELLQQRLGERSHVVVSPTSDERPAESPVSGGQQSLPIQATPLIGRDNEIDRLRALLLRAEAGAGQVAIVLGEAGIGKSRLLAEVVIEAFERGSAILVGRAFESEQLLAFGPWVSAIRESRVLEEPGTLDAVAPIWRAELARLFPELGEPAVGGRGGEDHLRLFEAIETLLASLGKTRPTVLVLEDLHWADEMSLRLLSYIGRRNHVWKLLVVASARPEELAGTARLRGAIDELLRDGRCVEMTLGPLTRESTIELARSLARPGERLSPSLEEKTWVASEGNPFMAVEIFRAIEQGTEVSPTTPLPAPERVRALIVDRLDRLSPRGQAVAAVAAVIGREFEFALLERAAGLSGREAAEAVEELVRRRLFQGTGERLDFTHDRIREVAYERLLSPTRQVLHREVVGALEALSSGNEHVERLAHHAVRGGLREKATHYLRQAGVRAAARSALSNSRAWFEDALAALESLPESPSTQEQGFEIRLELRPVLLQLGEVRQTLKRLGEAETLAYKLDDDVRRGRACGHRTTVHSLLGELDDAIQTGRRALEIAHRHGDLKLRILTTGHLEQAHHFRGEYEEVVELATGNLTALPIDWVHDHLGLGAPPAIYDRIWLVWASAELGRFSEASEYEVEALRLAERTEHAFTISAAHLVACALHLLRGEWAEVRALSERYDTVARTRNVILMLPTAVALSAWALAQLGEVSEALDRLRECEQLLERHASNGIIGWSGWDYHLLGHASLMLGRLDDAERLGHRALERSPRHPGFAAHAMHLLGDIAIQPDRFDAERGETHFREAQALAERRGMRPLVARCHLGLGKLYGRIGHRGQAREHLATATQMFRDMNVRFWLEQSAAEMKTL
jgi:DNA-binding SARP family transcriptional activator